MIIEVPEPKDYSEFISDEDMIITGIIESEEQKWLCLYCGGVQRIDRVKCENCGAPRSVIIG